MAAVQSVSRLCRFGCLLNDVFKELKCVTAPCMGPPQLGRYYTPTNSKECYRLLDLLRAARHKHGSATGLDAAWQRAMGLSTKPASHSKART